MRAVCTSIAQNTELAPWMGFAGCLIRAELDERVLVQLVVLHAHVEADIVRPSQQEVHAMRRVLRPVQRLPFGLEDVSNHALVHPRHRVEVLHQVELQLLDVVLEHLDRDDVVDR